MPEVPHDRIDLLLAPVALELDGLLEELGSLTDRELLYRIVVETDHEAHTPQQRRDLLLELLTRDVDSHGWALTWEDRGLCLRHEGHQLSLGLSSSLRDFVRVPEAV